MTVPSVWLGVGDLVVSPDYQMRQKLSKATVDEYAELIIAAESPWPFSTPCTVYRVKDDLILVDGFHRVAAIGQAGEDQIEAVVIEGSKTDALKAALSANITHGLRRSNDDKRRAVTVALADSTLSKWSDRKLADLCGVGHPFVASIRSEVESDSTSEPEKRTGPDAIVNGVRIGADGKKYPSSKASQVTQREKVIAAVVASEGESDREIARIVGCSDKTVASVRRELESEHSTVAVVDPDDEPEGDEEKRDLIDMFIDMKQLIRNAMHEFPLEQRKIIWQQVVEQLGTEDILKW